MSDAPKRSGGLQRKTPLRSTKPMKQGKGLAQGKGLSRSKPLAQGKGLDPKGSGLERKTPLAQGKGLAQGKPLSSTGKPKTPSGAPKPSQGVTREHRAKPMKRTAMKYSPPSMSAEERACRDIVEQRSQGICERCGKAGPLEKAHRVARSQQGKWDASNILDLCNACHAENHAHPTEAYEAGQHLRSGQAPLTSRVLLWKRGRYDWATLDDKGGWRWVEDAD